MNQAFFEYAMNAIDNLTDEELHAGLQEAGIDATLRQFPEPLITKDNA